jgi:TolB-like protein/Tfp pilus assembly protein PilF
MSVQSERRLAAIMFTDIVGYTALSQADEANTLLLLEEHRTLLRSIFPRHNGREVKTIGDAFLVEFPSALQAVMCSTEIQRAMHDRNVALSPEKRIQIRVGVHVGDVVHAQGDILGDAVNVSSRIEPLAAPGGICISAQVFDHVRNKVGLPLEKLEGTALKNVSIPVEVYRIVMPWEMETKTEDAELDVRRIAVLPLKNMSPDPNDEYFAEGMTEELITSLATVTELTVIARTSTMQYKNSTKRIGEIGRELNAGTLIEGSVRKAANKVRITIQLIDARNEGHLWAQNYDKQLDDVFAIQSEVAQKVAEALKVRMRESGLKRIEKGTTKNPEAHTLYLKGMFYWNRRTPEALTKAAELFAMAVDLDPAFALGYAGMAQCYQVMAANYYDDPAVYYPKAIENARKALSLDDGVAEAHTVVAAASMAYERDLGRSEAEFRKAIELNPSYPTAHQWYSHLLAFELRLDEALAEIRKAAELSPLSLIITTNLTDGLYYNGQYDESIAQGKKVMEMDPGFSSVYPSLIQTYLAKSMFSEALAMADTYGKLTDPTTAKLVYAWVYAAMGKAEESRRLLSEVESLPDVTTIGPFFIAIIYFILKDNDAGFEWLERAYTSLDRRVYAMAVESELNGVRSDPRYLSMLDRIGLSKHLKPR